MNNQAVRGKIVVARGKFDAISPWIHFMTWLFRRANLAPHSYFQVAGGSGERLD